MVDQAKKELGNKHFMYANPTNEEIQKIKSNPAIEVVGEQYTLGLSNVDNGMTLQIGYEDEISKDMIDIYPLQKGNMPQKENEIAIDSFYIEKNKIKNPIGTYVRFKYDLPDFNGKILYTGEKEFKIVGVIKSNATLKAQGSLTGVVSKDCIMKNIPLKNKVSHISCRFKSEKNIQKQCKKLIKDEKLNEKQLYYNNALIKAVSDGFYLKLPYIAINIVLAFTTALLIYNIFYVLISKRIKDFGIMRSIGFVPSDILKIIFSEICVYLIASIPIGIILGLFVSNISQEYIIGTIYSMKYVDEIKTSRYFDLCMITACLSVVTVIVAVFKPIKDSIKVDPMICIRNTVEKIYLKPKSRLSSFVGKIFKSYGNLSAKNIQRNKKRSILSIFSICIVIFLTLMLYTKSTANFLGDGGIGIWIPGDFLVNNIDIQSDVDYSKSYDASTLKEIESISGVKKVNASRQKEFRMLIDENKLNRNSSVVKLNLEKNYWEKVKTANNTQKYRISSTILGIENTDILDKVLVEGKENLDKLNQKQYIYVDSVTKEALNLKVGDKIDIFTYDTDVDDDNLTFDQAHKFEVAGIITYPPIASQSGSSSICGIMSVNQFNKLTGKPSYERFDIWTSKLSNSKYIESELNRIVGEAGKGVVVPYKQEAAGLEKEFSQKAMVFALIIGVVILLSLFNFCNTVVTNINSRKREFALLKAIGITSKEIKSIIDIENLVYVLISYVITIVPLLVVRYITIKPFDNIKLVNMQFVVVNVIALVVLFVIIKLTSVRAFNNLRRENFMEEINEID
jgi:ABC-type lipoprotein release transport system permease subunit